MTRRSNLGLAAIVLATLAPAAARAASWKTNVNYGASTPMDLYVPDGVTGSPAVVISLHFCGALPSSRTVKVRSVGAAAGTGTDEGTGLWPQARPAQARVVTRDFFQ